MPENCGTRINHGLQRGLVSLEVGNQDLDRAARHGLMDAADRLSVDPRATVGQLVAIHARNDDVLQFHLLDGLGNSSRLILVQRRRHAVRDTTVLAGARAYVTENHERGRSVFPALSDVRTAGFLTYSVKALGPHHLLEAEIVRPTR